MKGFYIYIFLFLFEFSLIAQIGVSNTAPNNNPNHLVNNVLVGGGVVVSNITFSGSNQQIGYFSSGNSIGINSGIVMSSGHAVDADLGGSPNSWNTPASGNQCANTPNTVCNDLYTVANSVPLLVGQGFSVSDINDMCVLEFDFIPSSDTVTFNYSFGSEEYTTPNTNGYENSPYNDVFGFFISGPGITGPYSSPPGFPGGSQNLAIVPGSNPPLPITVSSIHPFIPATWLSPSYPAVNAQYYNTGNNFISYNGYTDVFTAIAVVQPCETYHIRLAIADGTDDLLDSGVFLEANSFSSTSLSVAAYGVSVASDSLTVQCNATIDLEAQINGPFSVLWNTGDTNSIITVGAGVYSFVASSTTGSCVLYSDTVTVVEESIFNVDTTVTNIFCHGDNTGEIDLFVSGGTFPYTYSWTNSNTGYTSSSQDLMNLSAGTYECVITDDNGCNPPLLTVTISEPLSMTVNNSVNPVTCNDGNDGSILLNISGGVFPYTINWISQNGYTANTSYINFLSADVYTATIFDANGCGPLVENIILNEPSPISSYGVATNISCYGFQDGSIDLTTNGNGLTYNWTGPNSFVSSNEDISNLLSGTYTVDIFDANNCVGPTHIFYIDEPNDIIVLSVSSNVSCYSYNDGLINLTIQGGTGYVTTNWTGPNGYSMMAEDINSLAPGLYTYVCTDILGCTPSTPSIPIVIAEPSALNVTANYLDETCYGDQDGEIDVTISGSGTFLYDWTGPNGFSSNNLDLYSLAAGTYNLTITDLNNCIQSFSQVIDVGSFLDLDTNVQNISCYGSSNGSIDISCQNSSSEYYQWFGPNGFSSTLNSIVNLDIGNYSVIVNDASNCPTMLQFNITEPLPLSLSYTAVDESCTGSSNGEIEVFINGGTAPYVYVWNNGVNIPSNSNLISADYIINVLDNNNCVVSDTIFVGTSFFDTLCLVSDVSCFGGFDGSIDLSVIGGNYPFVYNWSNGETTQDIINLSSGVYTVDITDATNCTISRDVIVTQPQQLAVVSNVQSVSCYGENNGSVDLQINGGISPYIVDWGSFDPTLMSAGVYQYVVTDANLCSFIDDVEVFQADSMQIFPSVTDIQCYGFNTGEIDLQIGQGTGTPPYHYEWTGPNGFTSTNEDLDSLSPGVYNLVVTDANMCVQELQIIVSFPVPVSELISINTSNYSGYNIDCKGNNSGWVKLQVDGGYPPHSFTWNTGSISDSIHHLYSGSYSVLITDGFGCNEILDINLTEPLDFVTGDISSTTDYNGYNISCSGFSDGAIEVNVLGGVSPYSYSWNIGGSLDSIFNLSAGYYEVFVYDKNNCFFIDSITLNEPSELILDLFSFTDTCARSVGKAEVIPFGGTAPYLVNFSNGSSNFIQDDLYEGLYNVLLIDNNLCEKSDSFEIGNLPSPIADFSAYPYHKRLVDQMNDPFYFVDNSETFWTQVKDWSWDFGDLNFGTDSVASHSYLDNGTYRVFLQIITESNCVDTISKTVLVDDYNLYIPNTFIPSSDIIENTGFKSYGEGILNYEMKIFSRWGQLIFETNKLDETGSPSEAWDGTYNNNLCPAGVYTYTIVVENIYGEVFRYQDQFKLLR